MTTVTLADFRAPKAGRKVPRPSAIFQRLIGIILFGRGEPVPPDFGFDAFPIDRAGPFNRKHTEGGPAEAHGFYRG